MCASTSTTQFNRCPTSPTLNLRSTSATRRLINSSPSTKRCFRSTWSSSLSTRCYFWSSWCSSLSSRITWIKWYAFPSSNARCTRFTEITWLTNLKLDPTENKENSSSASKEFDVDNIEL